MQLTSMNQDLTIQPNLVKYFGMFPPATAPQL
eukprot:g817.t1